MSICSTPDRDATGANASGSVKFNLGAGTCASTYSSSSAASTPNSKVDQNGLTLDPGAGATLLIPGPNGGASGFALGANPLNIVRDASYSAELEKSGGRVAFGQTFPTGAAVWGRSMPSISTWRPDTNTCRSTSASPAAFRALRAISFMCRMPTSISSICGSAPAFTNTLHQPRTESRSTFGGSVEAGPDFSSASGSDRLSFTGFADSFRPLDRSKTEFGFGAGAFSVSSCRAASRS